LEKELLGFYLTSHPLDDLVETLPMITTHTLADIKALKDGAEVRVGGLVASAGQRMSKKNKPLIIGSLEDFTGANDFLVFGEAVQTYKDILVTGNKVVINAKVSFRGDEEDSYTLIVNSATLIGTVEPLVLQFNAPPSFEEIAFIGKVLATNKGELPVILQFAHGVKVKTSPAYWVDATKLVQVKTALQHTLKTLCTV
jgi:DNA polymerase-3 subunit alpha